MTAISNTLLISHATSPQEDDPDMTATKLFGYAIKSSSFRTGITVNTLAFTKKQLKTPSHTYTPIEAQRLQVVSQRLEERVTSTLENSKTAKKARDVCTLFGLGQRRFDTWAAEHNKSQYKLKVGRPPSSASPSSPRGKRKRALDLSKARLTRFSSSSRFAIEAHALVSSTTTSLATTAMNDDAGVDGEPSPKRKKMMME
jgi:hypothetical protein